MREDRKFGLVFGTVLLFLGFGVPRAIWSLLHGVTAETHLHPVIIGLGSIILLSAIFMPGVLRPAFLFFTVGMPLFITGLLLIAVFFLIITPLAIVMRLMGKDTLYRRWDRSAVTYWVKKEKPSGRLERYERQF